VTIYRTEEDSYLFRLTDEASRGERTSRSAFILSIIEQGFEKGRRLGEIPIGLGVLSEAALARALTLQKETSADKLLASCWRATTRKKTRLHGLWRFRDGSRIR
jgi:hypothetical protein